LTANQKEDLTAISKGCQSVLSDLDKLIKENHVIDGRAKSLSTRSKRVWKRLNWEPADGAELRARISSNVGLLNAFNIGITK
jgi:hypothetical protein